MAEADRARAMPALEAALTRPRPRPPRRGRSGSWASRRRRPSLLGKAYLEPERLARATCPPSSPRSASTTSAEVRKLLAAIEEEASPSDRRDRPGRDPRPARPGGRPLGRARRLLPRVASRCSSCHSVEGRGAAVGPVADPRLLDTPGREADRVDPVPSRPSTAGTRRPGHAQGRPGARRVVAARTNVDRPEESGRPRVRSVGVDRPPGGRARLADARAARARADPRRAGRPGGLPPEQAGPGVA